MFKELKQVLQRMRPASPSKVILFKACSLLTCLKSNNQPPHYSNMSYSDQEVLELSVYLPVKQVSLKLSVKAPFLRFPFLDSCPSSALT